MFSETSNISATTAKLCSSSSILSSMIVTDDRISNSTLSAGIITSVEVSLKSVPGGCMGKREMFARQYLHYQHMQYISIPMDTLYSEV